MHSLNQSTDSTDGSIVSEFRLGKSSYQDIYDCFI